MNLGDGAGGGKPVSELRKRVISALVLAPIVLGMVWWGGYVFAALAALVSVLIIHEWTTIVGDRSALALVGGFGAVLAAVALATAGLPAWALLPLAIMTALALGLGHGWLARGVVYAGLTGIAMVALRSASGDGLNAILFVIAVVWATDILAYFTGRAIGGPKLWPRISPKKTWSGAIGGLVGAVICGVGVAIYAGAPSLMPVALVAAVMSVASQAGDLYESHIKRVFGVKDSGTLIPGHGGVMDRVDGVIFAVVLAAIIGYGHSGGADLARGLLIW